MAEIKTQAAAGGLVIEGQGIGRFARWAQTDKLQPRLLSVRPGRSDAICPGLRAPASAGLPGDAADNPPTRPGPPGQSHRLPYYGSGSYRSGTWWPCACRPVPCGPFARHPVAPGSNRAGRRPLVPRGLFSMGSSAFAALTINRRPATAGTWMIVYRQNRCRIRF